MFSIAIAVFTSTLSTSLIHFCVSPYVTSIKRLNPEEIEVESLSFVGNPVQTRVKLTDFARVESQAFANLFIPKTVTPVTRSMWNWMPKHTRRRFYIHPQQIDEAKTDGSSESPEKSVSSEMAILQALTQKSG
jgi:hypothetical protein